jgi:hypothetical protein
MILFPWGISHPPASPNDTCPRGGPYPLVLLHPYAFFVPVLVVAPRLTEISSFLVLPDSMALLRRLNPVVPKRRPTSSLAHYPASSPSSRDGRRHPRHHQHPRWSAVPRAHLQLTRMQGAAALHLGWLAMPYPSICISKGHGRRHDPTTLGGGGQES